MRGDCTENSVRVSLVGRRKLLVVGTAFLRPMPQSTRRFTFFNRHVAAVCVLRGRNERTGGYSPQFLLTFFVMVAYNCRRLAGTALQQLQRIANRYVTFS